MEANSRKRGMNNEDIDLVWRHPRIGTITDTANLLSPDSTKTAISLDALEIPRLSPVGQRWTAEEN